MHNEADLLADVTILVVEDDPASARLLSVLLTNHGATVRIAHDGEDAVEILRTFAARIVVVDLVLPRMSGLLLATALRAAPRTRDTPIIAVSVIDGPDTERIVLSSGCVAYVRKPIDVEKFALIVASHLQTTA